MRGRILAMPRAKVDAKSAALSGDQADDLEDTALIIVDTQRDFVELALSASGSAITSIPGATQFEQRL